MATHSPADEKSLGQARGHRPKEGHNKARPSAPSTPQELMHRLDLVSDQYTANAQLSHLSWRRHRDIVLLLELGLTLLFRPQVLPGDLRGGPSNNLIQRAAVPAVDRSGFLSDPQLSQVNTRSEQSKKVLMPRKVP